MDQVAFECLISGIASEGSDTVESSAEAIYQLSLSKEIQDLDWPPSLYDSIWTALHTCWKEATSAFMAEDMSQIWKIEKLIWSILNIIQRFPEFDLCAASDSASLSVDAVHCLFDRTLVSSDLIPAQECMHWIYQNRVDLRDVMRRGICSALQREGAAAVGGRKARHKDGGRSRHHVAPLLEVLNSIIKGFSSPLNASHQGLLLQVLMPLHRPNEMVEWRDQVPVLHLYHPQLVRCLTDLIEKSDIVEVHSTSSSSSSAAAAAAAAVIIGEAHADYQIPHQGPRSLLPAVIKSLLSYWPTPQAANTPKEVLMLHELEALVVMAVPPSSSSVPSSSHSDAHSDADLLETLSLFLKRIVRSLGQGGDSDNFRTTQRALQVFKNKQILQLLSSHHSKGKGEKGDKGDSNGDSSGHHPSSSSSLPPPPSSSSSSPSSSLLSVSLSALIPALYKGANLSWNPTVNKMTALALRSLRDLDPELFERTADTLIRPDSLVHGERAGEREGREGCYKEAEKGMRHAGRVSQAPSQSDENPQTDRPQSPQSMQSHINKKMKPPVPVCFPSGIQIQGPPPSLSTSRIRDASGVVSYPSGVTGMAPWAVQEPAAPPSTCDSSSRSRSRALGIYSGQTSTLPGPVRIGTIPPRSRITGAPLGSKQFDVATRIPQAPPKVPPKVPLRMPPMMPSMGADRKAEGCLPSSVEEIEEGEEGEGEEEVSSSPSGYRCLVEYMERCLPTPADADGLSKDVNWREVQAALTPTLLPALRFHDLVFGHELGRGSFGMVKYARMIVRGRARSDWPEYAVKIVSADTMAREGYNKGALREMAVLQTVGHPGFARLISSFRYTHSAYLVLEYAGRGDLHSLLIRGNGRRGPVSHPLSHTCTRFVLGEISAALLSLHDIGLAYNDLKPENILITEVGHIKIADFGGCRPTTPAAAETLESGLRGLGGGGSLRNGDWKDHGPEIPEFGSNEDRSESESEATDNRLEGTPAYMPPELLRGFPLQESGIGSEFLSDSWALGCVASFCLSGRPLYMGTAEEVSRQHSAEEQNHQVQFDIKERNPSKGANTEGSEAEEGAAHTFISSLLNRDPRHRMSIREAVTHPYLVTGSVTPSDGDSPPVMDPLTLHLSPPPVALPSKTEEGGEAHTGGEDSLWARRQFSVLWAPMPASYAVNESTPTLKGPGDSLYCLHDIAETDTERYAPFCTL